MQPEASFDTGSDTEKSFRESTVALDQENEQSVLTLDDANKICGKDETEELKKNLQKALNKYETLAAKVEELEKKIEKLKSKKLSIPNALFGKCLNKNTDYQ